MRTGTARSQRSAGWLAGLGLVAGPWIVAGVISTFTPSPEDAFPWLLAAGMLAMVAWTIVRSRSSKEFARAAWRGAAIGLGIPLVLVLLLVFAGT